MKVSAILFFVSLWLIHVRTSNGEYRFRRLPPRQPNAQFAKKWSNINQRQSQQEIRGRPQRMPPQMLHPMNPHFKKPLGPHPPPPPPPRQIPAKILPVRLTQIKLNAPEPAIRNPNYREKAFLSSPTIKAPDYDFQLQTNQIPNHSNLIKQVDEKGPIHTIPAPNLSLADKPAHIEEVKPKVEKTYQAEVQKPYQLEIQKTYQLEVQKPYQLEIQKPYQLEAQKPYQLEAQKPYQLDVQKPYQLDVQKPYQVEIQKAQQYQVTEAPEPPKKIYRQELYHQEKQKQETDVQQEQELYKVLQTLPQQQQIIEGYQIIPQSQLVQQGYIQQYYPQDPSFITGIPQKEFHPEYLSFNYEEPTSKPTEEVIRFPVEYFENREVQDTNNVEPESAKVPQVNEELVAGSYYSSLPNKQAADALASLQAAGKQNTKNEHNKMTIYVPDDFGDDKSYEDAESDSEIDTFGSRIKPKIY